MTAGTPTQVGRVAAAGALALTTFVGAAPGRAATFFAERVVAVTPGGSQSPAFDDPDDALGGPTGGSLTVPSTTGLYNLGVGGSITLGFGDEAQPSVIRDGDGADFIVFENAFFAGGNPAASFAELMFVEVSSNGTDFARFPTSAPTAGTAGFMAVVDPAGAAGFAGVSPVLANVDTHTIDPFDPAAAGGDAFDLADLLGQPEVIDGSVDLQAISFLRLIDVLGDGSLSDSGGAPIFDDSGFTNNGADLDAVAVINGVVPEPTAAVAMLTLLAALPRRRSRPHAATRHV